QVEHGRQRVDAEAPQQVLRPQRIGDRLESGVGDVVLPLHRLVEGPFGDDNQSIFRTVDGQLVGPVVAVALPGDVVGTVALNGARPHGGSGGDAIQVPRAYRI